MQFYVSKKTHNDLEVIKLFLLYIFFSLFNVDKFHGTLCLLGYDVMCNFMIFNLKLYYCIVYCIIYIIYYIILYNIVYKMPLAKNNMIPNTEEMCILIEFFSQCIVI